MFLVTLRFLAFLALLLLVYYLLPQKAQWISLLAGSLFFYWCAGTPWTFVYVAATTLATWYGALRAGAMREKGERCAKVLLLPLIVDLGILAVLKYSNFALLNTKRILSLFHLGGGIMPVHFIASLGISFYTLQAVGYVLDVYWGSAKAQKNPLKVMLFLCWFPQMTSGPISRYEQLAPRLFEGHRFSYDRMCSGMQRILIGFVKKLVLADNLGIYVRYMLDAEMTYRGYMIWIGMIGYVLQIYADFGGCMDIALGAAECFGIEMTENFNRPFHARSIQEFWKRWHITLGMWGQDYLMYPILRSGAFRKLQKATKKRFGKKAARQYPAFLAMLVLWLFIGLWHGGDWHYIAEVLWFWAVIVTGQLTEGVTSRLLDRLRINRDSRGWHWFQSARTAWIYGVGALFFMSDSVLQGCRRIWYAIKPAYLTPSFFNAQLHAYLHLEKRIVFLKSAVCIGAGLIFFAACAFFEARGDSLRGFISRQVLPVRWILLYGLLFMVILFGVYGPGYDAAAFIYGGF